VAAVGLVMVWPEGAIGGNARADLRHLRRASPGSIVLAHDGGPQPKANPSCSNTIAWSGR
jgi:hypothetical protein